MIFQAIQAKLLNTYTYGVNHVESEEGICFLKCEEVSSVFSSCQCRVVLLEYSYLSAEPPGKVGIDYIGNNFHDQRFEEQIFKLVRLLKIKSV